MAKLVLSRRKGESVMIGDLELKVQSIELGRVKISGTWLLLQQWIPLENCEITVREISGSQVKIMFEADPSVKIMRTELLKRMADHV